MPSLEVEGRAPEGKETGRRKLATEEAPKGGVEETKTELELDQHCKKARTFWPLYRILRSCWVQEVLPRSYIENPHILQAGRSMGTQSSGHRT